MAHKRFLKPVLALLALALVIALSLSGCSNPAGSDLTVEPLSETYITVKGAKTYELTITQSPANAQAKYWQKLEPIILSIIYEERNT